MEAYENELVMKCFIVALLSHTAQGRGAHWWLTSTMILRVMPHTLLGEMFSSISCRAAA